MKLKNLLVFPIILLLLMSACSNNPIPPSDEELGCEEGYAVFGNGCCEDRNNDKLCDPDGNINKRDSVDFGAENSDDGLNADLLDSEEEDTSDDSAVSLSRFPRDFNRGEKLIIAGSEGSAFEIKVVNNFLSAMVQKRIVEPDRVNVKLDIDDFDSSKNHILFGSPCNNAEIVKLVDDCSSLVPSGKGLLKMFEKDGVKILVIAGEDEDALDRATERLLNGMSGEEVVV